MWFAAMGWPNDYPWTLNLIWKLLHNDPGAVGFFRSNPFPQKPPRYIRAVCYRYAFVRPNPQGLWWKREKLGLWLPPLSADNEEFIDVLAPRRVAARLTIQSGAHPAVIRRRGGWSRGDSVAKLEGLAATPKGGATGPSTSLGMTALRAARSNSSCLRFFVGRPLRLVPAKSSSCFSLIDSAMLFEAPLSEDFFASPRFAASAAPAAICCFLDFAGIPKYFAAASAGGSHRLFSGHYNFHCRQVAVVA